MKQLVKKLLLFSFLIFLVGIGLSFFLPANTYWGNPEYSRRNQQSGAINRNHLQLYAIAGVTRLVDHVCRDRLAQAALPPRT